MRSDGSVAVMRADEGEIGASGGIGFEAGPRQGRRRRAHRQHVPARHRLGVPRRRDREAVPAHVRLVGRREALAARVAVRRGGRGGQRLGRAGRAARQGRGRDRRRSVAGVEASAEAALGTRVGRGRTTIYIRSGGGRARGSPTRSGTRSASGSAGPVVAEYTRDRGGPRELAFRVTAPGAEDGEVVETVARLDLRVPANRAVAERVLRIRAPWPPAMREDLRAVIRHTAAVGTVERSVYAVDDDSIDLALAGRLGAELGIEGGRTKVDRRLVVGLGVDRRLARAPARGLPVVKKPPARRNRQRRRTYLVRLHTIRRTARRKRWNSSSAPSRSGSRSSSSAPSTGGSSASSTRTSSRRSSAPARLADVVYVIVGLAGLAMVPRLLEDLRLGDPPGPPHRRLTPRRDGPGVHTRPARHQLSAVHHPGFRGTGPGRVE